MGAWSFAIAIPTVFLMIVAASRFRSRWVRCVALIAAMLLIGALGMFCRDLAVDNAASAGMVGREVSASGRAACYPSIVTGKTCFYLDIALLEAGSDRLRTRERVQVVYGGRAPEGVLFPGAGISAGGTLKAAGPRARERGAAAVLEVRRGDLGPDEGGPPALASMLHRARGFIARTYRRCFTSPVAGLMEGITLGDTSGMDPWDVEALDACGLVHVVSVSGLHVSAAAAITLWIAAALRLGKRKRYILAAGAGFAVMALASFRPSASRSWLMACAAAAGVLLGREHDPMTGLAVAGIAILSLNPRSLFDPGFRYSFAAAFGIVALVKRSRGTSKAGSLAAVTCGAQLGVLPLVLAGGDPVPVTAIAANILAVPLTGPLLLMGCALSVAGLIDTRLARLLACVPALTARFVLWVAGTLAKVPGAYPGGTLSMLALVLYIAGLCLMVARVRSGRPALKPLCLVCCAVLTVVVVMPAVYENLGCGSVTILDVGQGDSCLIRAEGGATVLVDGGPDGDVLMKKLIQRGVSRVDLVVLSHPHADHLMGLIDLLDRVPVGAVLSPGIQSDVGGLYERFLDSAKRKEVPVTTAREGDVISPGGDLSLTVLRAPADLARQPENLNETSLVLMADVNGMKVLLCGDVERAGQAELVALHPDLACHVLKVPHQGAEDAAGEELIEAARPQLAAISVGRDNEYGHPSRACLDMLSRHGVSTLRTDRVGDIEVGYDGGRIGVSTSGR